MKKEGLAKYLSLMNSRSAMTSSVRLTAARKAVLREFVKERIEEICIRFKEEGEEREGNYCAALKWISNHIDPPKPGTVHIPLRLTPAMASWMVRLVDEQDIAIEVLSRKNPEDDFCAAMQWITNQWNRRWSRFKLIELENNKGKRI